MRAAPLFIVTLVGACAHPRAVAPPLSFTVAPTESRAIGWPPNGKIFTATLKNLSGLAIRVGSSAQGNVHIDSLICDGRQIVPLVLSRSDDCCYAGSCTWVNSREVRNHVRELAPGEQIDLPLRFVDELVEPGTLYRQRWYRPPVPSRCLVRFVYGPSGLVGAAQNIRSNVIVLDLVPAPPRPAPASDEPHLPGTSAGGD